MPCRYCFLCLDSLPPTSDRGDAKSEGSDVFFLSKLSGAFSVKSSEQIGLPTDARLPNVQDAELLGSRA